MNNKELKPYARLIEIQQQQKETIGRYEEFIMACRFAGESGLPRLRKEANNLLNKNKE